MLSACSVNRLFIGVVAVESLMECVEVFYSISMGDYTAVTLPYRQQSFSLLSL